MQETLTQVERKLFDEQIQQTGISEFGTSWNELLSGKASLPPEGARFDIAFEGTLSGEKINGTIKGTDFLDIRADGCFQIHIHAVATTYVGENIALREDVIFIPPEDGSATGGLRLNLQFWSSSAKYLWLNRFQVLAVGKVDTQTGKATLSAHAI